MTAWLDLLGDIVTDFREVQRYDWRGTFADRLTIHRLDSSTAELDWTIRPVKIEVVGACNDCGGPIERREGYPFPVRVCDYRKHRRMA